MLAERATATLQDNMKDTEIDTSVLNTAYINIDLQIEIFYYFLDKRTGYNELNNGWAPAIRRAVSRNRY